MPLHRKLCLSTSRANCNSCLFARPPKTWHFASAHPAQIATFGVAQPRHKSFLCLSTSRANCNCILGGQVAPLRIFASAHPAQIATSRLGISAKAKIVFASAHAAQIATRHAEKIHTHNLVFASAHPAQIATAPALSTIWQRRTLPQHIPRKLQLRRAKAVRHPGGLCLSTSRANCNQVSGHGHQGRDLCLSTSRANCNLVSVSYNIHINTLPQHIPRKLQPELLIRNASNGNFASAHPAQIATTPTIRTQRHRRSLPQHIPRKLQPPPTVSSEVHVNFASAHPAQIATGRPPRNRGPHTLCLSTSRANCNRKGPQSPRHR